MSDENVPSEESSVKKLQDELENVTNHWKRTAADFENFKRRKEQEQREVAEFAKEVTIARLLPTLDTLEQALRHLPQEDRQEARDLNQEFFEKYRNWQAGLGGLVLQLDKVLEEMGVKRIESVGKKFDPHFHEAVREIESDLEEGTVVDELQSGFELNGKVIRPSQVVISKKGQG